MDIKQVRYVSVISQQGSFSKAAAVLEVAQPILSRQIHLLEVELGVKLFYRNGRGVVLTDAGHLLQGHSRKILRAVSDMDSGMDVVRPEPTGRITVGMPPTVARSLAVPLIRRLRETLPLVSVSIVEGFSGAVLESMLARKMDLALLYDAVETDQLVAEPLLDDEHFLIGPTSNPAKIEGQVHTAELGRLSLIEPSGTQFFNSGLSRIVTQQNVHIEASSLTSILALVESGAGYSILPYAVTDDLVRAGRLLRWNIVEPTLVRQLSMVTPATETLSRKVLCVTHLIREELHSYAPTGSPNSNAVLDLRYAGERL